MLLSEAGELVRALDETIFSISDVNVRHRGVVTLSYIPTAVFCFLPLAVEKFNERYPSTKMRTTKQGTNSCVEPILCNGADFGINIDNIANSSIRFTPLVNESLVLACRYDHPLTDRQLVEWQELLNYRLIGVRSSSGNQLLIKQHLADKPWKLNQFYEVCHLSISLGLIETELGISTLPGLAMPQTPHPALMGVPLVEPVIRRALGVVRRKDTILSPPAGRFFSFLLNLWTNDKDSL